MKKLMLILCAVVLMTSCTLDDDEKAKVAYPLIPIQSVVIPDTMTLNNEYEVQITYTLPNSCYTFNTLIAEEQENLIYIGAQSVQDLEGNCMDIMETGETSFQFLAAPSITGDSYTFKFWQGENGGTANYLTKEVVIIPKSGATE